MRNAIACLVLCAGVLAGLEDVTDLATPVVVDPGGAPAFSRGDCNQDKRLDIADAICILGHLFNGEAVTCKLALDGNDDNRIDIADAIYLLTHLFAQGPAPKPPFGPGVCGIDPTPAAAPLSCVSHKYCESGVSTARLVRIASRSKAPINVPLLAVIEAISEPSVACVNADGLYAGKPCFDYSALVPGGALPPGGETAERTWSFTNPSALPFTLTIRVLGSLGGDGWLPAGALADDGEGVGRTPGAIEIDKVEYLIRVPGVALAQVDVETDGKTERFQELSAPRCGTPGVPGMPSIPVFTQFVAVPLGAKIEVAVKPGEPVTYNGMRVMPLQSDQVDYDGVEPSPFYIRKEYSVDAFYPESLWSVDTGIIRGMRIAVIRVALGQFNGATGVLRLYPELQVYVEFPGAQDKAPSSFALDETRAPGFERILGATLINESLAVAGFDAVVGGRSPWEAFRDCLIITAPAFWDQAAELAEWKTERGLRTVIASTDSTGTTAAGIADYIRSVYSFRRIEYVILFGDAEHIPTFQGSTHPWNPPDGHSPLHIGTDLFYATLDGAGDFLPDLAVGRISVNTADEAQRIVNRIKNYEGALFMASDFFAHPVLAAYFQDGYPKDGKTEKGYVRTCEDIVTYLDGRGYDPTRVYTAFADVDPRWYSDGSDIPDYLKRPTFAWDGTGGDVVDAINAGTFLVGHRDHGARGGWSHPSFTSAMADGLANGDTRLPLMFSLNCQTGWFDCETDEAGYGTSSTLECFAERLLRAPAGGALAVITPTRNSPSLGNDQILRGMIDCVWPTFLPDFPGWGDAEAEVLAGSRRIGHIMNYGKYYLWAHYGDETAGEPNLDDISYARFQAELYQCLGDPTINLRTKSVQIAVVSASRVEALLSSYHFDLPPEFHGAVVSVLEGDDILGQAVARDGAVDMKLRRSLLGLPGTMLNVECEGFQPVSVPIQFTIKRALYALRVPREKAGPTNVAAYAVDADGRFKLLQTAAAAGPGVQQCCPSGFAGSASHLFAGANQGSQIAMFAFKDDGSLAAVHGSPFTTVGQQVAYLAVDRAGTRLFARTGDTQLEFFQISPDGLSPLWKPYDVEPAARALATFEAFGSEWLYVGQTGNRMGVRVYQVFAEGPKEVQFFDLGALASRPGFAMAVARERRLLYLLDLDAGIFVFGIDAATGRLALRVKEPIPVGGFSVALCLARDEEFLYATLPLSPKVPEIVMFSLGEDGIPERIGVQQSCPDIQSLATSNDDALLYGASRADDGICVWPIAKNGTLGTPAFVPDAEGEPAPQMLWAR